MTAPITIPLEPGQEAQVGVDVRLENFEGPLDLLLFLIKKNDLDIKDIPIAQITQEYLVYLDLMKDLNLETAGEFLVMASTLMLIKAHMLMPAPELEEETGPDPRAELMNKLLEYQQYKEAAGILAGYNEKAKDVFYRTIPPHFGNDDYVLKASVFDLMNAFKRILEDVPKEVGQILREEMTIEAKIREILDVLAERTSLSFADLFAGVRRRIDLIVTFLATLELIRLKQIVARQAATFGDIRIYRADSAPAEEMEMSAELATDPAPATPLEDVPLQATDPAAASLPEDAPVVEAVSGSAEPEASAPQDQPIEEVPTDGTK
jgi:segregation and condensation protein A